jgi:hypothetical protein
VALAVYVLVGQGRDDGRRSRPPLVQFSSGVVACYTASNESSASTSIGD